MEGLKFGNNVVFHVMRDMPVMPLYACTDVHELTNYVRACANLPV